MSPFLVSLADGIGVVTLNRPERRNALTPEIAPQLREAFRQLHDDPACRVIVLTGAPGAFCAGTDVVEAAARYAATPPSADDRMRMQGTYAAVVVEMRATRQPIIAAVNGPAVGLGMSLALGCELRVVGTSALFRVASIELGVTAGELGISYHLPRIVGSARAAEIMLTGRTVSAEEAVQRGIALGVYADAALLPEVLALAARIGANTRYAVEHTKQVLWANVDAPSLDAALRLENHAQIVGAMTDGFRAAVVGRADVRAERLSPP